MADAKKTKKPTVARGLLARPLDSLIFLLPFILFYEVASWTTGHAALVSADDRVVAFQLMRIFFELFGATGMVMPGLAVVVILLATHAVSGQSWRIKPRSVVLLYAESAAWAVPLISMNRLIRMSASDWPIESWVRDATLGIGAGVYEELVFRLVLISVIVIIGADLLRFSHNATLVAAVLIAAGLFALHHHPPLGGEPFDTFRFCFRSMAGAYLGVIFVFRGYGPAAGAHIAYNLIVVSMT